jgi:hypothetical protein
LSVKSIPTPNPKPNPNPTPSLPSSDLKKNPLISELHLVRVGVRIRVRGKIRFTFRLWVVDKVRVRFILIL